MQKQAHFFRLPGILILFGLVFGVYWLAIRPAGLRWGATSEEVARSMPGDDLVQNPTFNATRAITIDGSPAEIWPWLVQMGYGRAGYYGYDLFENIGSPLGIRSADRIIPELQHFQAGDSFYIWLGQPAMKFWAVEPQRYLTWGGAGASTGGSYTWALYPIDGQHTRLVSRIRFRHLWIDYAITDWADSVAVRKVLLGVKDRVEGRIEPMAVHGTEMALWLAALAEFIAALVLIFKRENWGLAWLAALASAAVGLVVFYAHPPLWAGASLELLVLAGLLWIDRTGFSLRTTRVEGVSR